MTADLTEAVTKCSICQESQPANQREPMLTHPIPRLPWQSVASDCLEIDGQHYVVIVDLYSDYIELTELPDMSTKTLINQMKPIFATHGTPAILMTDNGTNFVSKEFKDFTVQWDITHITSSPHHPKSNGKAEAAVKTAKKIIKKAKKTGQDLWKVLLEWRNTITPGMINSPAQRLLSRRTRSFLPCASSLYKPEVQTKVVEQITEKRQKAKYYHDKKCKELPDLIVGQPVMVKVQPQNHKSDWTTGKVKSQTTTPRSYVVEVKGRNYRRNRIHLKDTHVKTEQLVQTPMLKNPTEPEVKDKDAVVTRSGRLVKAPDKLSL